MTTPPEFSIAGRPIGPKHPVYVIAELSANHHQDYEQASRLLRAAKDAGADAVKLQTYTPDTMTLDADASHFRVQGTIWDGRKLYDLYQEAFTPWDWHPKLQAEARALGMQLFSTPFDASAVEFLEKLDVPAYKIASFELTDTPLLELVGSKGRPIILSTGMASREEIQEAVATLRAAGAAHIALLKCTSAYPSPPEAMHLRTIPALEQEFRLPVGLSDHTLGATSAVVSVALGACIVEKHMTMDRSVPGPDSAFSLEPAEFRHMVDSIREAEMALGGVQYGAGEHESKTKIFRRSIFVVEDVQEGEPLTLRNLRVLRPAAGIAPKYLREVVGRRARRAIPRGTPLSLEDVDGSL